MKKLSLIAIGLALLAIPILARGQSSNGFWILQGTRLRPITNAYNLRVPALANCSGISVESDGDFICGSGGGGTSTGNVIQIGDNRYVRTAGDTMTGSLTLPATSTSVTNGLIVASGATKILNYQGLDLGGITYAFFGTNRTYGVGGWSATGWLESRKAASLQIQNDELRFYQFAAGSLSNTQVFSIISGGNVGIGTTTPKARLTVAGSGAFTGTLSGSALNIQGGTSYIRGNLGINSGSSLVPLDVWGNTPTTNTAQIGNFGIQSYSDTNGFVSQNMYFNGAQVIYRKTGPMALFQFGSPVAGDISFRTAGSAAAGSVAGSLTDVLVVKNTGNVGIGTGAPAGALSIHRASTTSVTQYISNTTTGQSATDGFALGLGVDEEAIVWQFENTPMRFATSNTERMRILANGNVGIGTTTPVGKLHVAGSGSFFGSLSGSSLLTLSSYSSCNLETTATGMVICGTDDSGGGSSAPEVGTASFSGGVIVVGDSRYVLKQGDTMTGQLILNVTGGDDTTVALETTNAINADRIFAGNDNGMFIYNRGATDTMTFGAPGDDQVFEINSSYGTIMEKDGLYGWSFSDGIEAPDAWFQRLTPGTVKLGSGTSLSHFGELRLWTLSGANVRTDTFRQPGLDDCDADNQTVNYDATTRKFGCGDDDDTNTTYTAGRGLGLNGTSFSLNSTITGSLLRFTTVSGALVYAKTTLASSGTLVVEGVTTLNGATTINDTLTTTADVNIGNGLTIISANADFYGGNLVVSGGNFEVSGGTATFNGGDVTLDAVNLIVRGNMSGSSLTVSNSGVTVAKLAYQFPTVAPSAGQILTAVNSTVLDWATPAAGGVSVVYENTADSSAITSGLGPTAFDTSYTIPANACASGKAYRSKVWGTYNGGTNGRQPRVSAMLGGTALFTSTANSANPAVSTTYSWYMEMDIHCVAAPGAAASVVYKVRIIADLLAATDTFEKQGRTTAATNGSLSFGPGFGFGVNDGTGKSAVVTNMLIEEL